MPDIEVNRPALLLLFALLLSSPVLAQGVPWHLLDGSAELGAAHREVVAEVLSTANTYGECKGTILECLIKSPEDKIARRLANFVVRRAAVSESVDELLIRVGKRKVSAHAIKTFSPGYEGLEPSGNPDAPVKVLIYADFECPYCRVASTALRELSLEQPDTVAFYFKSFPLKAHKRSVPAAIAFLAGAKQDKFWEMQDILFVHQEDLSDEAFESCAAELGLDMAQFTADLSDEALIDRLRAEKREGLACGVKKSPGILINGKPYYGVKTAVELRDRIDEELYLLTLQ